MLPRKNKKSSDKNTSECSTSTSIYRRLAVGTANILGAQLPQLTHAQDIPDHRTRTIYFTNADQRTGYAFSSTERGFDAPFEQIANGVCNITTDIISRPVDFQVIQRLEGHLGELSRGVGQVVQNGTEACLEEVLESDSRDYLAELREAESQETEILLIVIGSAALVVSAALLCFFIFKCFQWSQTERAAPMTPLPESDNNSERVGLLDIERQDSEEPAKTLKTITERLQAIEQTATEKGIEIKVPESFICPISQAIMEDPVIGSDEQTYNRPEITKWLNERHTSPNTREQMTVESLRSNRLVKEIIEEFLQAQEKILELSIYKEGSSEEASTSTVSMRRG